jgi:LysW-gamma-L-lysine carboxypeptidase
MNEDTELLKQLVTIYSETGHTEEAVEFLRSWAVERKMEAMVDRGALIVNPKANDLLVLGHIDTVQGELPVKSVEGNLWGRGSVDAKGPLCAAILALSRCPEYWDKVRLVAVPDEEKGSETAKWIREEYSPSSTIILEPGGWEGITISYQGRMLLKVSAESAPSHSGAEGSFAVESLISGINMIMKETGARILDIRGDIRDAEATLDIRYTEKPAISMLSEKIHLEIIEETPPTRSEKNTRLVRSMISSIRRNGGIPVFKKKTGTSDMNTISEKWKVPILAYGPGDSKLDHTDEEHISLDGFKRSVEVWQSFFKDYFKN